jgi:hypothetical protein
MGALLDRLRGLRGLLLTLSVVFFPGAISHPGARGSAPPAARATGQSVAGQKSDGEAAAPPYVAKEPLDCQSFAHHLDEAVIKWHETGGTYLIVLARPGTAEGKSDYSRSRLNDVEDYVRRYKRLQYVTAVGSRVEGLGRVELYVGGKLLTVIPVKKNSPAACSGKVNPFL